jgi:hypothetical protein
MTSQTGYQIGSDDLRRRMMAKIGAPLAAVAPITAAASDTYAPPKDVQKAAQRGLDLLKEGRGGKNLTDVGRARGKQLAAGQSCSRETIRKMHAYFARHAVDRKPDWAKKGSETPGYVAWLLWGGDPGKRWADSMVRRFDAEQGIAEMPSADQFDALLSNICEAQRDGMTNSNGTTGESGAL